MELLAPAGNILAAYSAFKGGADAIYLGGKQFSARASADNFSEDEIKEITFYAHSIGRKVYVTLNTLLFQDEFMEAVKFAQFLYKINVDGVIIQDLGLAYYLHKTLPNLPLNASTQLNCHNLKQAEALIKIGFKRIVLARETNLETAKKIKALGVEVEVFGHGALCVSYSGNCLLSSFIGDRSGNRGRCAQPCRLRYSLCEEGNVIENNAFEISTKDLMTLDNLNEIIDSGIDSLKIEGRLKSNEYIYAVSNAYRHAIDAAYTNKVNKDINNDKTNLTKIFNRQFTKGYLLNESPFSIINSSSSSHQGEEIGKTISAHKTRLSILLNNKVSRLDGIRIDSNDQIGLTIEKMFVNKEPVECAEKGQIIELVGVENAEKLVGFKVLRTKDFQLNKEIENKLKNDLKVNVIGTFNATLNEPISLSLTYKNIAVTVQGDIPFVAENQGTSKERIISQLKKSGSYPYAISKVECNVEKCFIPISSLNKLRNDCFDALKNKLIITNNEEPKKYEETSNNKDLIGISGIITENNIIIDDSLGGYLYQFKTSDNQFRLENRITFENDFTSEYEIVHFPILNTSNNYLIASPYCSITNSYSLDCYYSLGFSQCILSLEVDSSSAKMIIENYKLRHGTIPNVGFIVYGKQDMMIMRSCPIGTKYHNKNIHCNRCHNKTYELIDRIGEKYHLVGDSNCNIRVLSNRPIYLLDVLDEIEEIGITNYWLILTDEDKEKVVDILNAYNSKSGNFNRNKHTRGHYTGRPL